MPELAGAVHLGGLDEFVGQGLQARHEGERDKG